MKDAMIFRDRSANSLAWQARLSDDERHEIATRSSGQRLGYDGLLRAMTFGAGWTRRRDAERIVVDGIETYTHADDLFARLESELGFVVGPERRAELTRAYHGFLGCRAGLIAERRITRDEPREVRVDAAALADLDDAVPIAGDGTVRCYLLGETGDGMLEVRYRDAFTSRTFVVESEAVVEHGGGQVAPRRSRF